MSWHDIVAQTAAHLGLDLVDLERSAGGLLRVTIDWPWQPGQPERAVSVEDCENLSRQLQYALEVEGVDYRRLEVSSPGIDRPLRSARDFERFVGWVIDLTLKDAIGAAGGEQVAANRKKFRGTLDRASIPVESADSTVLHAASFAVPGSAHPAESEATGAQAPCWRIVWSDAPAPKPGQRVSKKRPPAVLQELVFALHELREARLAPIVDFKGRAAPVGGAGNSPSLHDGESGHES